MTSLSFPVTLIVASFGLELAPPPLTVSVAVVLQTATIFTVLPESVEGLPSTPPGQCDVNVQR